MGSCRAPWPMRAAQALHPQRRAIRVRLSAKLPDVEMVDGRAGGQVAGEADGDEWRASVIMAIYTGIRHSEQLALRWSNVDLEGARMQVVEALEKTKDRSA